MDTDSDQLLIAVAQANSSGRLEEAESLSRQALELKPNDAEALLWLSVVLRKQGRASDALAAAGQAVDVSDNNEHALNQLGLCCLDLGQPARAAECFTKACAISPTTAPLFENLGRALLRAGRNAESISAFRKALAVGPAKIGLLLQLGEAYMNIPDSNEAAECAQSILRMDPGSAPGHLLMARALIAADQVSEGSEYAKRAVELAPQSAAAVAYYGRAMQSLGRLEEASEQFRRSIEREPNQGFAYFCLTQNRKVVGEDLPLVTSMLQLAEDSTLPPKELLQLEFALGKAFEDLGDCESAMRHFDEAHRIDHRIKDEIVHWRRKDLESTTTALIQLHQPAFFERFKHSGINSELPVFLVGMMRSGTTLAEQILSSHKEIGGVGEEPFWTNHAGTGRGIYLANPDDPYDPQNTTIDEGRLLALAHEYLELLTKAYPRKLRVVDKMNQNYLMLGLLHIAFPEARFIHMRRHPVDTCLSIWATPVANGIDLGEEKENVVFIYRQYLRIMEHWRAVLPQGRLLDVSYEELVNDRERITRQMLAFIGLEWDRACMSPEQNTRAVKTPSISQVRQPVYKTSLERWRKYETCLGAFAELFQ